MVGVLGGMGPEATVELMRRVIAATPAVDDADHIHMIVDNNPKVPSRIKALIDGNGENPGPVLAAMAKRLERAGASFLVIPCNTAHHYWRYVAEAVEIPVWDLVDIILKEITAVVGAPTKKIGMLASPALRRIELYESRCARYGVSIVYPEQDEVLLEVIQAIKANRYNAREANILNDAAQQLRNAGVNAIVLGCTEFSLVAAQLEIGIPIFDTLQVLAERIVTEVEGSRPGR